MNVTKPLKRSGKHMIAFPSNSSKIDWSAGRQGVVIHELFRFRF
jgi:hypothetical protein